MADEKQLGCVNIWRCMVQGDSLSPLLLVVVSYQLHLYFEKKKKGYPFGKRKGKINHLLFGWPEVVWLYGCYGNEIDSPVQTVKVVSKI